MSIDWTQEIKKEAGKLTRDLLDKMLSVDRAGSKSLSGAQRKELTETTVNLVIRAMLRLGTFLTVGGSETVKCKLDEYVNKGGKPIKVKLLCDPTPENVLSLGENAGKEVTVSFVNALAFEQARDELLKSVHRDQMDWLEMKDDPDIYPTQPANSPEQAEPPVSETTDSGEGRVAGSANAAAIAVPAADVQSGIATPVNEEWTGDDLSQAPAPIHAIEEASSCAVEGCNSQPENDASLCSEHLHMASVNGGAPACAEQRPQP